MTDHIGDVTQMVPMTRQRLDEIRARCEVYVNAHGNDTKDWYSIGDRLQRLVSILVGNGAIKEFAELAAHSIFDVSDLLAEVERLREELSALRADVEADSKPLTPDELLTMDGKPAYVQFGDGEHGWAVISYKVSF